MKIKMNVVLKGPENEDIKRGNKELTLKIVAENALLMPLEGDKEDKKYEKWELYKKIRDSKDIVELTTKEAAFIKECIGKHEPPLIMGQCWDLIEDNTEKK